MSAKLQIKRGTTAAWNSSDASIDNTLAPGQLGVEYLTDNKMRLKVGKQTTDGSATKWSDLPYVTPPTSVYTDSGIHSDQLNSFMIGDSNQGISFNPNLHTLEIGARNADSTADGSSVIGLYSSNSTSTSALEVMPGYISLGSSKILVASGAQLGDASHILSNIYTNEATIGSSTTGSMKISYNPTTEALEIISL